MGKINSKDYLIYRINLGKYVQHDKDEKGFKAWHARADELSKWKTKMLEFILDEPMEWFYANYGLSVSDTLTELLRKHEGVFKRIQYDRDEYMFPLSNQRVINWIKENPPPYSYIIKRTHTTWLDNWKDHYFEAEHSFNHWKNSELRKKHYPEPITYEQKRHQKELQRSGLQEG